MFKKMALYVILLFIFLASSYMILPQVYAETIVIIGSDDAYVDEDAADENFGQENLLASGLTNTLESDKFGLKEAISYIQFDLTKIPKTDWWTAVTINSVNLSIFTEKVYGDAEMFLVDVYYCDTNSWLENEITWNNRSCKDDTKIYPVYSGSIISAGLPTRYDWNLSNLQEHIISNNSEITFIVKMNSKQNPIIGDAVDKESGTTSSLVHFSSSETNESGGLAPKLIVSYSTLSLIQREEIANVTAVFSILGVGLTIYELYKKIRKK